MEPIVSFKTKMCRICPNTLDLIDLSLPENYFIIKNLDSLVFIECELLERLPRYICQNCNSCLTFAVQFKTQISNRIEEIKSLLELSTQSIKNEIIYDIEEVILDPIIEELIIKEEQPEPIIIPSQLTREPERQGNKIIKSRSNKKPPTRTCLYCKEEVGYKQVTAHNNTHTDCPLCPKKYANFKCLQLHYKIKHRNVPIKKVDQKFACEICGKEFQRKKNIIVHIRSFHNNERNHVCEICNKGFYGRTGLEKHKLVHSDEKPFFCKICNKGFKLQRTLTYHMEVHEEGFSRSVVNKLYICPFCGKQTRGLSGHIGHQRIHTKELPYECKVCKKKFRLKSALNCHSRIHTGEKPFKCNICPKRFRIYHFLKTHKLSHGGENVEKFKCNLCGMSTVYKDNLEAHMKSVHLQFKSFDCQACSESFTKISLLKTHMLDKHDLCL